jgi:hypothetical protein
MFVQRERVLEIECAFDIMQLDIIRISKDRKWLLNQEKSSLDGKASIKLILKDVRIVLSL